MKSTAQTIRSPGAHPSRDGRSSMRVTRYKATRPLPYAVGITLSGVLLVASSTAHADSPVVTKYSYDAGDHIATITDPRGLITAYSYDGLGQLWGVSSPDTGITTSNYDAYGRRSSLTRADDVTTTYTYDDINRLASISAGGQAQRFSYDSCTNGLGRVCFLSDATGTTAYNYTAEGQIAERDFSIRGKFYSLEYSYDAMGQLTAITYPDYHQAIYSYSRGVVSGITFTMGSTQISAASNVTWRPMDAALAGWTSSNGLTNTLAYDDDGRLTGINVPGVESLSYRYDLANRLTGIDNVLDGTMSQDFGYDDQSRLKSMYSPTQVASYSYDADGNRIRTVTGDGTTDTNYSPTSNRLISATGVNPQTYGYDDLGNLTILNSMTAYQYDAFNRMSVAGGATYYVNPEGQRLAKTGGAGAVYFAPDTTGELLAEYANDAWIDYVWLNGQLIGREVNGQLEAIHADQLGRPQVVTDASQTIVWSAQNWPFTRNVTLSHSARLNLGFPGQYYDQETGLWNNGFRDYDPTLGRYVESDPLGLMGGINTYAYGEGDPVLLIDPRGLQSVGPMGAYVGGNYPQSDPCMDKASLNFAANSFPLTAGANLVKDALGVSLNFDGGMPSLSLWHYDSVGTGSAAAGYLAEGGARGLYDGHIANMARRSVDTSIRYQLRNAAANRMATALERKALASGIGKLLGPAGAVYQLVQDAKKCWCDVK